MLLCIQYVLRIPNGLRSSDFLGRCLVIQRCLCTAYDRVGKEELSKAIEIEKENWGLNHTFFRDNKALIWKKIPYIVMYLKAL